MSYKLREFRKDSTVEVAGPFDISHITGLKEALERSLNRTTENIAFRANRMNGNSYACLQLLCSTCKSSFVNGKGFRLKGKLAKPIFELAMSAGFPSRVCRENKYGECCLVGANEEMRKAG